MNNTVTALRFFLRVTLDRPEMARHLTLVRQPRKLPNVLNEEEVVRLLESASGLKCRAALGVACGAGLRVSEVANQVSDIDSKRMLIRVEEGTDAPRSLSRWIGVRHPEQEQRDRSAASSHRKPAAARRKPR